MLFVLLHPQVMRLVDKTIGTGDLSQKMGEKPAQEGEKKPIPIPSLLLVLLFIISIFIPLKLGTIWLFIGLLIYLAGLVMFLSALITAAQAPSGHVFTAGMYRYSRHPLYVAFVIIFMGISITCSSWLFLLLSMGWMYFPLSQVAAEERGCLESFGSAYQQYMLKTPRWLGIPKS
jgi:protein-S-isoprenylcysteine O-methyltransferase Ste14